MKISLLEDGDLYDLAQTVVPEGGSGVNNAQISGLLAVIRQSRSYAALRAMTRHQFEKAGKEGNRGAQAADFHQRLFKALKQVEQHANDYVGDSTPELETKKARKKMKDKWSGRLALTLMTHVAAEHRWQGSCR